MKPTVIDPKTTTRAEAYALWMDAPNPMVTFFKTLDVAPLIRFSRRRGMKFNMLLCFCIGKAASESEVLLCLWAGAAQNDTTAVNTIVKRTRTASHSLRCAVFDRSCAVQRRLSASDAAWPSGS